MKPQSAVRRVTLLALLAFVTPQLAAEEPPDTGRVVGVLTDPTGAVVPAATVEIRNLDSSHAQTSLTNAAGRYVFSAVSPGRYTIAAMAPGFEPAIREDFLVLPHVESVIDLDLEVGRTLVLVEVTAPAAARPLQVDTDPRQPRQPIPAHDGADYLKTIPGFSVIRKGGTDGDPVLRGMAGSRLGILLDGENILGGCGNRMDPPTAYAFPEAYDRITVLKGPQTVRHGPGNSAGIVLFEREQTVQPGFHVYASPTVGSFGRHDEVAEVKAAGHDVYLRASATRSAMSDYVDGSGWTVHSGYERWSTNGAFGWTPDSATRVEVSTAFSDGQAAYADRMMDGVRFSRRNLGAEVERRNVWRFVQILEAQAFYNYVDHVMDNYSLRPFVPSMTMPAPSASNPDRRTIGGRVASDLQLWGAATAHLGVDWQSNRHTVRSSSNATADPFETHPRAQDATFDNLGVYGELTQGFGARQRLIAGARIDRWTGRDTRRMVTVGMGSTAVNPTTGVHRREILTSSFARYERELSAATLYAGVGRAERAPDYWELVSKESRESLSAFNTRPEGTTQLDAGVMYRQGAVSGSVAMFLNGLSDFILIESNYAKPVASGASPMANGTGGSTMGGGMSTAMGTRPATIARNVDASTWGGEASLAWDVTPRVTLDTSLAYVRGDNDTDRLPLAQLPPLEARLGLRYAADRWSMGALTRLVVAQTRFALNQGNIVGQDLGPTGSFGVFSVNGGWRIHRLAHLSAGVDNLFDATYAEFISRSGASVPGFTTTTRVNEPGRTLWIKLDLRH
jgi:iron complex outermembrane receptor protein